MAELTRLLSDIYGGPMPSEAPVDTSEFDTSEFDTSEFDTTPFDDEMESHPDTLTEAKPIWENEESLDEAFAAWQPGPDQYASDTEREMVADAIDEEPFTAWQAPQAEGESEPENDPFAGWAESVDEPEEFSTKAEVDEIHWSAHIPEVPVADVQMPTVPQIQTNWNRSNDDIIPGGVASRGLSFFRR
ncbi:MAG: hypothetical protein ACSLFB_09225 [Acidimicrobiales bacterium]